MTNIIKAIVRWLGYGTVILLLLYAISLVVLNMPYRPDFLYKPVTTTTENIEIGEGMRNPANYRQYESHVWMTVVDGQLYFYPRMYLSLLDKTKYDGYLSVFENGTIRRVRKIEDNVLFLYDGILYSWTSNNDFEETYYGYRIADQYSYCLGTADVNMRSCFFSEDGMLFLSNGKTQYPVYDTMLGESATALETYYLNESKYVVEENIYDRKTIVRYDQHGNRTDLDDTFAYGKKSVIPCKNGLLIHNEGREELLYLIREDTEEIIKLFSVPCAWSESAVNVYEEYLFFSFKRYEEYTGYGWSRFPNDTKEGTYRISLKDYSIEKISDVIYCGLYIFDDTGIYACDDNCNIYKLDFDGNVVMTLLGH